MHKYIPKGIFKQTEWVVLLFLYMLKDYPHANIIPESTQRWDAAMNFITPTRLHLNGRLRQLVYYWIQEAFISQLYNHYQIVAFQLSSVSSHTVQMMCIQICKCNEYGISQFPFRFKTFDLWLWFI